VFLTCITRGFQECKVTLIDYVREVPRYFSAMTLDAVVARDVDKRFKLARTCVIKVTAVTH
jgi:hypothetical protein